MTKQLGTLYSDREDFERGSNLIKSVWKISIFRLRKVR